MTCCVVCQKTEDSCLHEHHVIPQANGGTNGPTVMLCAEHHNMIHKVAVKILTLIRNGKEPEFTWPANHGDTNIAKYLVGEIVTSTLSTKTKKYKVILEFDQVQRDMLDLLKQELGVSSINKVLYSCLELVFKSRFNV